VTHLTEIEVGGELVPTLADILPECGELRALFLGKTPSPASVAVGHYFEGKMGRGLWKRLGDAGILSPPPGGFADDGLLAAGFGVTDICKAPRPFGSEPGRDDYEEGWRRVAAIVERSRPRILVFVYKGALDAVLRYAYGWEHRSGYGFNDDLSRTFGRRVFAVPLPGVACTAREARRHMADLARALDLEEGD
jgi:TDG/mug DNA glycosylase family protein